MRKSVREHYLLLMAFLQWVGMNYQVNLLHVYEYKHTHMYYAGRLIYQITH